MGIARGVLEKRKVEKLVCTNNVNETLDIVSITRGANSVIVPVVEMRDVNVTGWERGALEWTLEVRQLRYDT